MFYLVEILAFPKQNHRRKISYKEKQSVRGVGTHKKKVGGPGLKLIVLSFLFGKMITTPWIIHSLKRIWN